MEELIRDRIHEALEVEPTPVHLRTHVMASLPVANTRQAAPSLQLSGQWAAGLVAVFLALAIIAGLLLVRGAYLVPAGHQPPPPVGLISPEGIAVGPDGSVYVSDFLGDRVFRRRPDGTVVLYAGGGSDSDGPATKASLFHPVGLALDHGGNLYVADPPGGTIRKIDTHGNLSTVTDLTGRPIFDYAGPSGLAVDGSGGLWVSELFGVVSPAGMQWAGVDGSSLPQPAWVPGYIAFDAAGDLFISDSAPGPTGNILYSNPPGGGCRIIRMSAARKLSIIAGTGVCGFSGDDGPATAAQINDPNGIAFDASGNLYFADANNHRIRRIDRNGVITTVAGTGVQGYNDGPAERAQLQFPFGMGMSSSGLLYFADMTCECWSPTAPGRVRALNLATGTVITVMDGRTPIQKP